MQRREADERFVAAQAGRSRPGNTKRSEPFEVGWPSIRSVLVHLAWAGDIWGRRFLGETPTVRPTEADLPTLDDAAALLSSAHDRFANAVLPSLTPEHLSAIWTYRDFQGKARSVPRWRPRCAHVDQPRSTYHRGQLASKLKRRGITPPVTDFVFWCFEQTPQPEA